jgi:hypothetical protein
MSILSARNDKSNTAGVIKPTIPLSTRAHYM